MSRYRGWLRRAEKIAESPEYPSLFKPQEQILREAGVETVEEYLALLRAPPSLYPDDWEKPDE